ncbi:DLT1 [Auxenochlorella protothecoides x Auxenochlorella symbiontica]
MTSEVLIAEHHRGMDGMSDSDVLQASDIEPLIRNGIQATVHGDWNEEEALVWQEGIGTACLKLLAGLARPYKFAVTTHLSQRAGAGLCSATAAHWNPNTDGHIAVIWTSDTVFVCVTVFWAAV